ncbi:hypothetical protein FRC08_018449 [Ceratobasidium sp. 394]|nr:hypothetical protein FRC08_018449 [Ceratobasidium sp. 394]
MDTLSARLFVISATSSPLLVMNPPENRRAHNIGSAAKLAPRESSKSSPLRAPLPPQRKAAPKRKEQTAGEAEGNQGVITPSSILRGPRQSLASGFRIFASPPTSSKKRTSGEIAARDRTGRNTDAGASSSNQGPVSLIVVKYEGRMVAVRMTPNYEAMIKSVKEPFPSLQSLNDENIHLSASLPGFGKDWVEISRDLWPDMVSQLKTVRISVQGPEGELDSSSDIAVSRKRLRR